ncbi:MAG: selenocysteine-specific translation elongation factor [Desulfovibrionaceae bacterium]
MPVIMGTAGHIDHGKTTLVKALTGIDCDRLAEEKKRGITIELGFAFHDMAGGERLGIVDVPGHEKFVKNMVAGAAGVDFVLLVIAADEGVMPQTREHLEICTLLGVTSGIVALTKADMVEEEWLEMVTEDVTGFLAGTFLENAPLIPVSAHTGLGLDTLRAAIDSHVAAFAPRRRSDLARLPVDRIFTMRGHGTVVTGTLVSGSLRLGQELTVYPRGLSTKVRGLQSHGATVEVAPAGRRTAVNLHNLDVPDLERGDTLGAPGSLFPELEWDVELTCLSSSPRPLKHRTEAHLHHGAREVLARFYFHDREALEPGDTALCRVRFAEPMVGVYGDRCVVRSFSPLRTVAGGRLINPLGRKTKRFSEAVDRLRTLTAGEPADMVRTQLLLAGATGLPFARLMTMTDMESKQLEKVLGDLGGKQEALLVDRDARLYLSGSVAEELLAAAAAFLADFHKREPLKPGLARGALAAAWGKGVPERLAHFLTERLLKKGTAVAEGEVIKLAGHKVSMAADVAGLREKLLTAYSAGGVTPPNLKEVLEPLGLAPKDAQHVLQLLMDQGEMVKIKEEMFYHAPALGQVKEMLYKAFEGREEIEPSDFRDATGLSRKFTIPLLEYFDKEKVTVRVGDKRRLRKR